MTVGMGDDPYQDMLEANTEVQPFTVVYYLCFVFLSSVVLVNIFLAILVEAFSSVKESASNSETVLEGLTEVAKYDVERLRHGATRKLRPGEHRFLSDERLLQLLEIHLTEEQGGKPGLLRGDTVRDVHKRTGDDDEELVLLLPDGSRVDEDALRALLRSLIGGAPEKLESRSSRGPWWAVFRGKALASIRPSSEPEMMVASSPTASSPSRHSVTSRQAALTSFWASVKASVEDQAREVDAEGSGQQTNTALLSICRSLMSRYGEHPDNEEEDNKKVKLLKLEALEKQLQFFDRYDRLEKRLDAFIFQHQSEHVEVVGRVEQLEKTLSATAEMFGALTAQLQTVIDHAQPRKEAWAT